jgi:hypothetical protein
MYLASVVDNAIVGCHLLLQEMAPPPIMKTNPVVDLLSWMVLHQILISFAMYLANIERFV